MPYPVERRQHISDQIHAPHQVIVMRAQPTMCSKEVGRCGLFLGVIPRKEVNIFTATKNRAPNASTAVDRTISCHDSIQHSSMRCLLSEHEWQTAACAVLSASLTRMSFTVSTTASSRRLSLAAMDGSRAKVRNSDSRTASCNSNHTSY